jgi:two-component system NarL family response regulator
VKEVLMDHIRASVLVADDHFPTRERLRTRLAEAGFRVCVAGDADAAVRAAADRHPDLCLLDVNMPGGGGVSAVRRILDLLPATVIVMLTVSRDDADLFDALNAGATGYLLKDVQLSSIPGLLDRALEGEALLSGQLAARLVAEFRERGRRKRILAGSAPGAELSRREWQVLELLAEHLTTREIAARLFVEPVTVRTHVARILHKLQVPSRQAALRLLESPEEPSSGLR